DPIADTGIERVLAAEIGLAILVAHFDHGHQVVAMEDDVARIIVMGGDVGEPFHVAAEPVAGILGDECVDVACRYLLAHGRPAPLELRHGDGSFNAFDGGHGENLSVGVGWVERSETHLKGDGFRKSSTHPTTLSQCSSSAQAPRPRTHADW